MAEQTSWVPTAKAGIATGAATFAAPLSLIVVYLINGIAFGCWSDPTVTAVACKASLPSTIMGAISAFVTGISVFVASWLAPRDQQAKTGG